MLHNLLRFVAKRRAARPSRRRGPHLCCLQFDQLEERVVPVSSVTITSLQGPSTLSATVPVATEGLPANPSLNATFTDTNHVAPALLTVTVDYGDGTPPSTNQGAGADPNLVVLQVGGTMGTTYTITDQHTFPEESGSTVPPFAFTMILTVTETAVATNTDTATTPAEVLDAPLSPGSPVTPGPGTPFTGIGGTNISTTPGSANVALHTFEAAIGGVKNTAPAPQSGGFRVITWDGVKVDGTDSVAGPNSTTVITPNHTVGIPLDRFQGSGVFFGAVYAVTDDGFVDVNPSVGAPNPVLFPAFSPTKTFAMFNDNGIDFKFVAASPTNTTLVSAASPGFGAIFLNVTQANTTTITYFHGSTVLDTQNVPVGGQGTAVFAGELFPSAIVTNVLLTLGNGVIFKFDGTNVSSGATDGMGIGTNGEPTNLVAVDDWVFAEPLPIANGFPIVSGGAGTTNAATTIAAQATVPFTGVVATFSDSDPLGTAKDFTATINWGDGHLTNGTIQASGGAFTVSGTNTYARTGKFPVSVDIADFGGGPGIAGSSPTLSVTNSAVVGPAPGGTFFTDGNNQLMLNNNGTITSTGAFAKILSAGMDASGKPECFFTDGNNQLMRFDNGVVTSTGAFANRVSAALGAAFFTDGLNQVWIFKDSGGLIGTTGFASALSAGTDAAGVNHLAVLDGNNQLWLVDAGGHFTSTIAFGLAVSAGRDAAGNFQVYFLDGNHQLMRDDGGTFIGTGITALQIAGSEGQAFFTDAANLLNVFNDATGAAVTGAFATTISSSTAFPGVFFLDGLNQVWEFQLGTFTLTGAFGKSVATF
jgi:hypothetical protein